MLIVLLANIGPESGTAENVADFAHQLFFSVDLYGQKTKRNFSARVGIHSETIPTTIENDNTIREIWSTMVNMAYRLVSLECFEVKGSSS